MAGRPAGTSAWRPFRSWAGGSRETSVLPPWATGAGSLETQARRKLLARDRAPVVRAYCWARFWILRQRFLDEIGQYLPETGPVLDVGCGFGLFSLYYAATGPRRFVRGLDMNGRRIALARRAAARLGLANIAYEEADARDYKGDTEVAAAYMLDIVHHVPRAAVPPLLEIGRASCRERV